MTNSLDEKQKTGKIDTKELELAETIFSQDIENRVFQTIILQTLSNIEGITLLEGSLIDNLLRKASIESIKGISAEQDAKKNSINVNVEVNVRYGIPIPDKAEEIQFKIAEEITRLTGLHVSTVHVVFRNIFLTTPKPLIDKESKEKDAPVLLGGHVDEEFVDEF
jgi:uncharacterized alkaline shock family protein YloU